MPDMKKADSDSMIKIESNEGEVFEVPRDVINFSATIYTLLQDLEGINEDCDVGPIPIQNVNSEILKKVLEWCTYHKAHPLPPPKVKTDRAVNENNAQEISQWDKDFFNVEQGSLFDIILAANYLDIHGLLEIGCMTIANMMKGKSAEEIRCTFNIPNDFTPEEMEQISRENKWFED